MKNQEQENKQKTEEKPIDGDSKEEKKEEKAKGPNSEEEISRLKSEVNSWKNKYYEAYADMDNLRKKMEKDHEQVIKYRGQGFLEALLPIFDSFYNCFKFEPTDPNLKAYCQGFKMIYGQMINAIQSEGVKEFEPKVGDKYTHETMQAVDVVEGEKDDIVMKVENKGYFLKDRLVRPAMVVVSKKVQPKKEPETKAEESKKDPSSAN